MMKLDGPRTLPAGILDRAARWRARLGEDLHEAVIGTLYRRAESVAAEVVAADGSGGRSLARRVDDLLASRFLGYPLMGLTLGAVLWLTVVGANYPSNLLGRLLFGLEGWLATASRRLGMPPWWHGLLIEGTYRSLAWVVSVMLPPMAIFVPLFTLLEDLGYLPRVAFNLDRFFHKAGADGKQSLTMAMGFGCNAAGVVAARIIQSPRERLIAILTNAFVPCNGRFPTLIALASIFFSRGGSSGGFIAAAAVGGLVVLGVFTTLGVSWVLAHTILRGLPSSFALELPPYRRPRVFQVIVRSIFDRTLFVLGRAASIAAPAGASIWLCAHVQLGNRNILALLTGWLEPLGRMLGLDGAIVLAFLLGLPANELVLPIVLMNYLAAGTLLAPGGPGELHRLLAARGWTWITAMNTMLFSILHFPCGTTLFTMARETGNLRWPAFALAFNTLLAAAVCFIIAQAARVFHLL